MNLIVGGITGLVKTISFNQKQPPDSVLSRIDLPEHDSCVDDFNCALDGKIILQGNLYLFNTAMCFHSLFNKQTIVSNGGSNNDTIIFMPFNQIISIDKVKKFILFETSMKIKTLTGVVTLTSFLKRDSAYDIINQYRKAFYDLLPAPLYEHNSDVYSSKSNNNNNDNQNRLIQIQSNRNSVAQMQNIQPNHHQQYQQQHQLQQQQQQHLDLNSIANEDEWLAKVNEQILRMENNQMNSQNAQEMQFNQSHIRMQQPFVPPQINEVMIYNHNPPPSLPMGIPHDILAQMEHEAELEEEVENPLELQKSALRDFDNYAHVYAPLFLARAQNIKRGLSNEFNMRENELKEIRLPNVTVREVFSIFFSNVQFSRSEGSRVYSCFMDFYISEYLHAKNLRISSINPPPPEIYSSVYSSNYSELLDYASSSERALEFDHPIPNPSFFMPKSLHCQMRERIHWSSPHEFMLTRNISLSGAAMCKSFEPRVIFMVEQEGSNVVIRAGFNVHFKSSSMLKKIIENGAKDENDKNWNQMKNIICQVSNEYAEKRDANKRIEQRVNEKSFVRPEEIVDVENDSDTVIDEVIPIQPGQNQIFSQNRFPAGYAVQQDEQEEEESKQSVPNGSSTSPLYSSNFQNQQSRIRKDAPRNDQQQQQQEVQQHQEISQQMEQSLNQIAEKASKEACHIF